MTDPIKSMRLAGLAGSVAAFGLSAQATGAANDRGLVLEEIIVTAQKRREVLQDIPQSVTVVGSETFERLQADNLQDYLALVPGLSLESSTRGVSRITLRGINTGGVASTVGVYVDEVPFGSSSGLANGAILAGDFDTFDMARLEVLRGPQGTLYGASSLGGVLKFVTNEPQLDAFSGRAQAGIEDVAGGEISHSGTGFVNLPLSPGAALRVSGFYRQDGGFVDSIGNNPIPSLTDPGIDVVAGSRVDADVNELETFGGRASVLLQPTEEFSVRLTALLQNIESQASDYIEVDRATLEPLYGDTVLSQYHPEFTNIEYRVYGATVDWDIGFADLLSSTSYGTFREDLRTDLAFGLAPLITAVYGDSQTRPLSVIVNQTTGTDKFTQELRLSSQAENAALDWLVGAYYTREKSKIDPQDIFAVEAGTEIIAADVPQLIEIFLRSTYEEYAAFTNLKWNVTPRFEITFGGRGSHNRQLATQLIDDTALGGGRTAFEDARSSEDVFTYSVAPRFEINENTSVYARVATGYRPGGPNVLPSLAPPGTPTTYDSDRLTNYEVGLKTAAGDRRLSLDVAVYYLDWKDVQLFAVINDTGVNANGGTATSKGVEITAAALPTERLTLTMNAAYTDAYLTQDTDPIIGGLDGDQLPFVPELSANLNADYEWTVSADVSAYIGASVRAVRDQVADFGIRTSDGRQREIPSYETIDLRAGLVARRWSLELYAKNVEDELALTSLSGGETAYPNAALAAGVVRPRTIGLTLGVTF